MRFRKLRIAWSVVCGIACVLLIVLWVRSYWWYDMLVLDLHSRMVGFGSFRGEFVHSLFNVTPPPDGGNFHWVNRSEYITAATEFPLVRNGRPAETTLGFGWFTGVDWHYLFVPIWLPVVSTAALAIILWLPAFHRFSLRTLLIATTLVGVVLGLSVYVASK
jgi:hypothetical protein